MIEHAEKFINQTVDKIGTGKKNKQTLVSRLFLHSIYFLFIYYMIITVLRVLCYTNCSLA